MKDQPAAQANRIVMPVQARDRYSTRSAPASITKMLILDPEICEEWVRDRQERDIDKYDEMWEGVYVVPPLATNPHQDLAMSLAGILFNVVKLEGRGRVQAGANVSDRRGGWNHNFRGPDVVVVLKDGRAIDCNTHWFGGPDFLIEVHSPGDETDKKIPFYSKLLVRELLIIHRDTRNMRLLRHDGTALAEVAPSTFQGGKWLVSEVVPLAFRRRSQRRAPLTEVRRTDGTPGSWTV